MVKVEHGYLPAENPCAQCGKPIAAPEWIEREPHRICYLWHCWACDYRFEAVAYFDEQGFRCRRLGGLTELPGLHQVGLVCFT